MHQAGVEAVPAGSRFMTPEAAWHVGDVLAEAPRPARLPDWPLAFKTGTSSGHRDALALGVERLEAGHDLTPDDGAAVAAWLRAHDLEGAWAVGRASPVPVGMTWRSSP